MLCAAFAVQLLLRAIGFDEFPLNENPSHFLLLLFVDNFDSSVLHIAAVESSCLASLLQILLTEEVCQGSILAAQRRRAKPQRECLCRRVPAKMR